MEMKSQVLDKNKVVMSTREASQPTTARVTYARAKYFNHSSKLPKSEVVSIPQIYHM